MNINQMNANACNKDLYTQGHSVLPLVRQGEPFRPHTRCGPAALEAESCTGPFLRPATTCIYCIHIWPVTQPVPAINHTQAKIIQMNVLYFYLALLEHVYSLALRLQLRDGVPPFLLSAPRP